MNWYKIAQQTETERSVSNYYDIGHAGEGGRDNTSLNYMWVYNKGKVDVVEETAQTPTHYSAFPGVDYEQLYSGRYEPDTGSLSVLIPYSFKIPRIRKEVPNIVLKTLRGVFPDIKRVHVFT